MSDGEGMRAARQGVAHLFNQGGGGWVVASICDQIGISCLASVARLRSNLTPYSAGHDYFLAVAGGVVVYMLRTLVAIGSFGSGKIKI